MQIVNTITGKTAQVAPAEPVSHARQYAHVLVGGVQTATSESVSKQTSHICASQLSLLFCAVCPAAADIVDGWPPPPPPDSVFVPEPKYNNNNDDDRRAQSRTIAPCGWLASWRLPTATGRLVASLCRNWTHIGVVRLGSVVLISFCVCTRCGHRLDGRATQLEAIEFSRFFFGG